MVTTPGVEGWEDLRGETIALHSPSSISTATGRAMVADRLGNVDAAAYEYIVGTPSRLAAIEAGEVAAAVVFVSGALQAEREGYASALAYPWESARLRDQTTAALVVPESAVERRPATVERLVEAAEGAYGRLYEADAAAITEAALATDRFAEFDPAVWQTAFERVREAGIWPRDGGLDDAAVRRAEELLVDTGMIAADKRLPPAAFVAEGFR